MAYVVKPFTKADLLPAIEIALSRYAELQALEAEVADLAERLETRKARRPRQGRADDEAGADRAGGVPVDPEDRDGPPAVMREVADGVSCTGPRPAPTPPPRPDRGHTGRPSVQTR